MFQSLKWMLLFITLGLLCACATTQNKASISSLYEGRSDVKVLLMPLDVQLSLLTASGIEEPRADWTEAARKHMKVSIDNYQQQRGAELLHFDQHDNLDYAEIQRLHTAVGVSILIHEFLPGYQLPTKLDNFDWTLGPDVSKLKQHYDADYAMFIYLRDSYTSSGRVVLTAVAALLGVGLANGQQIGFASLVDLNTGKVSWFNKLHSTTGDLRTQTAADQTVAQLMAGLPE